MSLSASKPHTTNCPWEALKYFKWLLKGQCLLCCHGNSNWYNLCMEALPCQVFQVVAKGAKYLSVCQKARYSPMLPWKQQQLCLGSLALSNTLSGAKGIYFLCCHGNSRTSTWD